MIKDSREPEGEPASEQSEQSEGSLNKQVFSDSKTSVGGGGRPQPALPRVLLMVEFTAVNSVAMTPPQTAGFAADQVLIKEASLCSIPATRMLIPPRFH